MNLLARCTVSVNYVIIVSGFTCVCPRTVHSDSTKVKVILVTCRRFVTNVTRTRASSPDAETLKVQEILAAMRESRMNFCVLLAHFQCFFNTILKTQALRGAGVWSDGVDFEVLREIPFSTEQLVTCTALLSVAASCFSCSRASPFRIVFVAISSCQLWFQNDCFDR